MKKIVLGGVVAVLIAVAFFSGFLFANLKQKNDVSSHIASSKNTSSAEKKVYKNHRIAFIADTRGENDGINKEILTKTFKQLSELSPKPEYVIIGGDLVTGSKDANTYINQLNTFKALATTYFDEKAILPAYGNHEDYGSDEKNNHEKIFGETFSKFVPTASLGGYNNTVYYVDVENVRLIVLNSYHEGQTSQIVSSQLEWLNNSLADKEKLKFVFVHSPAFPLGGHVGSSLDMYPEKRDVFWSALDKNNVLALFCGHEHNYSRRIVDSSINPLFTRPLNQIVAGTAGASFNTEYTSKEGVIIPPMGVYHYSIIDTGSEKTIIKTTSVDGMIIDELSVDNIY